MTNSYYVGMDVHQRTTPLCLMNGEGTVVREWKVRTAPKELVELLRELRRLCGDTPVALGLEASTAGKATFQHLRKLGRNVAMAHPRALRAVTTSETKTDRSDARTLAHLLRLNFFPRAYVPEEPIERLRTLVRLREEQVDKLRRAKIQVRTLLVKHQLQHESLRYDDIFGVQALHWLKGVELPDPYAQRQLVLLLEEGALYARQVEALTRELAKVGVDEKTVTILQSVPGIDYVLALTIVAEVGDARRSPNRRKFAAYCGLVPKNRDSGEVVGRHSKLRHGSSRLKWAMLVAVQAIRKSGKGRFAILLKRLEKRIGTSKALAAVAHRLAFTVYGLWKSETLYDEVSAGSTPGSDDAYGATQPRLPPLHDQPKWWNECSSKSERWGWASDAPSDNRLVRYHEARWPSSRGAFRSHPQGRRQRLFGGFEGGPCSRRA